LSWFPFKELRPHQTPILRRLEKYRYFILQAPTGFGKSILTLTGIWYRFLEGNRQLYLLTKTKTQLRNVFLHNLKHYFAKPPADQLTILPLIARRDLCLSPQQISCRTCGLKSQAKYFPRRHLTQLLQQCQLGVCPETLMGFRELLADYGCPSDLILRMLPQTHLILTTHGYLESIFLRALFDRLLLKAEQFGFNSFHREIVIDEAHNFGPTIEATLSREQVLCAQEIGPFPVVNALVQLLDQPHGPVERPKEAMFAAVQELEQFLQQKRNRRFLPADEYDILHAVKAFIERRGKYWIVNEQGLAQLNPWPEQIFDFLRLRFHSIILLSATFHRLQRYGMFFGLTEYPAFKGYNAPTPPEWYHQLFFGAYYHPAVSSKPEHRTEALYEWTADIIHELALIAADEHTLVFVPSYDVLETLYPLLITRLQGQLSVYREPSMGGIAYFQELRQGAASVILAVYGGKFNEGIEIRHPTTRRSRIRLIILVGLPFPPPTPEFTLLTKLYRARWTPWFAYWALIERHLYILVQQCLGRAIRSEQDRAAAVILDYRAVRKVRLPGMRVFRTSQALRDALTLALIRAKKGRKNKLMSFDDL
jgi:Rad3-related DNA helicase